MTTFGKIMIAGALGVVVLLTLLLHSFFGDPVRRYIVSPMPESVRKVGFENNGLIGALAEPVVHIAFTASSSDMETIVRRARSKTGSAADREFVEHRDGPTWWKRGTLEKAEVLFMRQTRAGQEYLRVDGTGTNAYFLLWGI
jgi:hypothetical protein